MQVICLDVIFFCGVFAAGLLSGWHWALCLLAAGLGGAMFTLALVTLVCLVEGRRPDRRRRSAVSLRAAAEAADPVAPPEVVGPGVAGQLFLAVPGEPGMDVASPSPEEMLRIWYEDAQQDIHPEDAALAEEQDLRARAGRR